MSLARAWGRTMPQQGQGQGQAGPGRPLSPRFHPWPLVLGVWASAVTPGTCTDPQQHAREDDQLQSLGRFADSHQDGGDDGKDVIDQQGSLSAGTAEPRG